MSLCWAHKSICCWFCRDAAYIVYFQLYNAPAGAIGYFMVLDSDNVTADMTYFDFGGFRNATTSSGLEIKRKYY